MKKRILSLLLTLVMIISFVPYDTLVSASDSAGAITAASYDTNVPQGAINIVKRAKQMTEIEWTPQLDIIGWAYEITYKAGVTYKGIPYGQPTNAYGCRGDYVPWEKSLEGFLDAVNNENSLMYTSYANYNSRAPYYSTDCSGFVSWAWDLPVRTTASGLLNYANLISSSSYESAQLGDALCNPSRHVALITDITYDENGNIDGIEISEADVGYENNYCCKVVRYGKNGKYDLNRVITYYFNRGYSLYRSKTVDKATYTHSCAVPLDGDNCDKCGYSSEANARDFIDTTYPSYAEIVSPFRTTLWSFPCSNEVTEYSKEIAESDDGEVFIATALCLNTAGELWYKVTKDGKVCYIYGGDTELQRLLKDDIKITGVVEPDKHTEGKSFSLGGVISSKYNQLTRVDVNVSYGDIIYLSSDADTSTNAYNLKNSSIDLSLIFNDLKVGNYYYNIYAKFRNCYTNDGTEVKSEITERLMHTNLFKVISADGHTCDKGEYVSSGSEHPHYISYKCSVCGLINEDEYETENINTCLICRPGKPILNVNYEDNCSSEIEATLTWDATSSTTHYNLIVYKEGEDSEYTVIDEVIYIESGDGYLFKTGKYKLVLASYNNSMKEPDGGNFVSTWSDEVFLTVYDGHNYVTTVIAPTCGNKGYTLNKCSVCGDSIKSDYIEATGEHTYTNRADATCNVCDYIRVAPVKSVPMYRMYDPNSSEHFYTGSTDERDLLISQGWQYEGVGFNFPVAGAPVHRLYEPLTGEHLYTMDEAEKEKLISEGWNYEGVAFNSAENDEVPQYRLHNPNATRGAYHFTGSIEERDLLISFGWEYQGIGFYSCLR